MYIVLIGIVLLRSRISKSILEFTVRAFNLRVETLVKGKCPK